MYEKTPRVSGTWYENRYPSGACDVSAHNYAWSFKPKLNLSAVYAGNRVIISYFDNFAKKYHLHQYVKTDHLVSGAYGNNAKIEWDVNVQNLRDDTKLWDSCDILINASGIVNNWRWPVIRGPNRYKGTLLHTAIWDDQIDLEGKHIGLVGNG